MSQNDSISDIEKLFSYEPMIKMIFAHTDQDNVFSNAGRLPWSRLIKKDMEIFKDYTDNNILVMGRKTFESLPRKIRDLQHVVITSKTDVNSIETKGGDHPDVLASDIVEGSACAQMLALQMETDVCFIGGAELLLEASHFVDSAMITSVHFEGEEDEKRYYDAPTYIDLEGIINNFKANPYIDIQQTLTMKYLVGDGEIDSLTFTHFSGEKE